MRPCPVTPTRSANFYNIAGVPDYGKLAAYHEAVRRGDQPWTVDDLLERIDVKNATSTQMRAGLTPMWDVFSSAK